MLTPKNTLGLTLAMDRNLPLAVTQVPGHCILKVLQTHLSTFILTPPTQEHCRSTFTRSDYSSISSSTSSEVKFSLLMEYHTDANEMAQLGFGDDRRDSFRDADAGRYYCIGRHRSHSV